MGLLRKRLLLGPLLLVVSGVGSLSHERPALAETETSPGAKGAQIYCFMRTSGNSQQVSWDAAYGLVRSLSKGLFKTSRDQAAVMITEAVVQNPATYPDCGRFLGDLFAKPGKSETVQPSDRSAQSRDAPLAP